MDKAYKATIYIKTKKEMISCPKCHLISYLEEKYCETCGTKLYNYLRVKNEIY